MDKEKKMKRKASGFTLVEILIVVLIIALLALLVIPNFAEARRKAQRSRCLDNLRQINSAYQQYFLEAKTQVVPAISSSAITVAFQTGVVPTCPKTGDTYTAPANSAALPSCTSSGAPDNHTLVE
jgi:prepilin-type N-terminal cleavage/methylation domain-containing protein